MTIKKIDLVISGVTSITITGLVVRVDMSYLDLFQVFKLLWLMLWNRSINLSGDFISVHKLDSVHINGKIESMDERTQTQ